MSLQNQKYTGVFGFPRLRYARLLYAAISLIRLMFIMGWVIALDCNGVIWTEEQRRADVSTPKNQGWVEQTERGACFERCVMWANDGL